MIGELAILNVAMGDTKLTFDPSKPEELERSKRTVQDLIRRGFVILIEVGTNDKGPIYQRAHDFDPETAEYIIAGAPPAEEEQQGEEAEKKTPRGRKPKGTGARSANRGAKAGTRRVAATGARAVGVARTAGG